MNSSARVWLRGVNKFVREFSSGHFASSALTFVKLRVPQDLIGLCAKRCAKLSSVHGVNKVFEEKLQSFAILCSPVQPGAGEEFGPQIFHKNACYAAGE